MSRIKSSESDRFPRRFHSSNIALTSIGLSLGLSVLLLEPSDAAHPDQPRVKPHVQAAMPAEFRTTKEYNKLILNKVNDLVKKHLYCADLVSSAWTPALEHNRAEVLDGMNLHDLFENINHVLASLKSSHCEFVTTNDETFYFLHDLFGRFNHRLSVPIDFVGFVTGPPRFAEDEVRYVLDGSPASTAGVRVGDKIISVNGKPWIGQMNLVKTSGKPASVEVERDGKRIELQVTPVKRDAYMAYVDAIRKSARKFKVGNLNIGYVHLWCGGQDAHNAFLEVISDKMAGTDGMILDLRDGYGGNSLEDLDYFYRTPAAYPDFVMKSRNGKTTDSREYYEKPIVALINDGARSGKELLAFSFKRANRAKLVGTKTAGAFLAGKLFPIDKRTSLYLALSDCTVGGVRLEGTGVAPDVVVEDRKSEVGKREQLQKATELLLEEIKHTKSEESPGDSVPKP